MDETQRRLGKIEEKLDNITETLGRIAVQDTQINNLASQVNELWGRWNKQAVPHISQCPKNQVRWLWAVVAPMGLSLLALGVAMIGVVFRLS